MKYLASIFCCLSLVACAQPVLRQSFTTNSPGQFQSLLPTINTPMKLVGHVDGSGTILETLDNVYSNGVWFGDGSGLTNLSATVVVTTIITNNTFLTFINTNLFTNIFTTNLFATNITAQTINVTDIKLSGKAQLTQIILTNGFFSQTNLWSGPTNTLDCSIYNQSYQTVTPISITGFINASNSLGGEVKLKVKNAAATNVTFTFPAGDIDRDHVTSQTITNGTVAQIWINVDPALGGSTNQVFNDF